MILPKKHLNNIQNRFTTKLKRQLKLLHSTSLCDSATNSDYAAEAKPILTQATQTPSLHRSVISMSDAILIILNESVALHEHIEELTKIHT